MIKILEELKDEFKMVDWEIAQLLDVTIEAVYYWRKGKRKPNKTNTATLTNIYAILKSVGKKKWYKGQAFDYVMIY